MVRGRFVVALAFGIASSTLEASANAPTACRAPDLANFSPRTPAKPVHTEYVVETNRLGRVTRVRSVKPSNDPPFDALTYGNALQAFNRTARSQAHHRKAALT